MKAFFINDLQVKVVCLLLAITSIAIVFAKVKIIGTPFVPDQVATIWAVEARIDFNGMGRSAMINLDIPDKLGDYLKLDEFFISRNYGLNVSTRKKNRYAEWSIRNAKGKQRLYYRIEVVPDATIKRDSVLKPTNVSLPAKPAYEEPLKSAVEDTLARVRDESADIFTFASQLLKHLNSATPNENVLLIREGSEPGSVEWVNSIIYVLAGARIPARLVRGLSLNTSADTSALIAWLEVHNGERWEGFDPLSGNRGYPDDFLRWATGSEPLLTVKGGKNETISFTLSQRPYPEAKISQDRASSKSPVLGSWSLYKLPLNTQDVYKILLMLPLGALVVVFMRTIVGIPSFGTFMPILIALAFRETELLWGIILFCIITAGGLSFRFFLERMNLLLVPRLSSVLVMVIIMMLLLSLVSNDLDIEQGISIALFPIVILTMVIERMSITWEETGALEAMKESLGSLVIAILGYFVMTNNRLEHLMFHFPEFLLLILALVILAGRYTGYRLSELFRFRDLTQAKD